MASRLTLRRGRLGTLGLGGLVVAAFAVFGVLGTDYNTGLLTTAFVYAIAAVSLDLVWGYVGAPDLGHALWFGIGALSVGAITTITDKTGLVIGIHGGSWRYPVGIVLGMALSAALAGIVGRFSFSARGSAFYIAVVTLALTTVATTLYSQFPKITGGDNGLFGFGPAHVGARTWYFVALVSLVAVVIGAVVLVRSDLGLLLRAVRDNETRTRYLGYDVERIKTVTFMGGAAVAAFAGGLMAVIYGLVSSDLFSFVFATQMLVWVAVGGRGTIIGPVVGAIVLQLVGAHLSAQFPTQWNLIEGVLFVLVVVFVPDGVLPFIAKTVSRLLGGFTVRSRAAGRRESFLPAGDRCIVADPSAPPQRPTTSPVIAVSDLHFGYGSLRVLRGVDLNVNRGELLCVVGPNGAGKSTLVSVLADGNMQISGEIRYELGSHTSHRRRPPHRIARYGVSRKFQAPQLFESLSAAETVLLAQLGGRLPSFWRRSEDVAVSPAVVDVLDATGLNGRDNEKGTTLAHGLKQGLEIAAAVASRPQVLLLDEPTAGLTFNERAVVGKVLRRLVNGGMTVILIEHDLDFVNEIADRVVVLHGGQIIQDGTPDEVSSSQVVREAYLGTVS